MQKTAYEDDLGTAGASKGIYLRPMRLPAEPVPVSVRPAVILESPARPKRAHGIGQPPTRPMTVENKIRPLSTNTKPPTNLAETWDQQMQKLWPTYSPRAL